MTRIVAGAARGRRLAVPARGTRPTTDRVRESVFNVLAARLDFEGLRVLDLFAGSGALGLEALSRGARSVLFIESDRRAAEVIDRNIATVGLPGTAVRRGAVAAVLGAGAATPVDLVFADPPYEVGNTEVQSVLSALGSRGWLALRRRGSRGAFSEFSLRWPGHRAGTVWPSRRYGDTRIEVGSRHEAAC